MIASDYVPNTALPSELMLSTNSANNWKDYCAYFGMASQNGPNAYKDYQYMGALTNYVGSSDIATNNELAIRYLKWPLEESNRDKECPNMRATALMMDTTRWSNFTGEYGSFAIGGPTIEMYAKSYNAKHNTKLGTYNILNTDNTGNYGYKVQLGTGNWGNSVSELDTNSGAGDMWVITNEQKALYMWIASPADGGNFVSNVNYSGTIGASDVSGGGGSTAFRPLVAISKFSMK